MIKKLFKVVIPIFLSILFGSLCGKLVFSNYDVKIKQNFSGKKIYLIQIGAYSNYDNMVSNTLINKYIYYQDDDGLYKSVVGITFDKDNIDKIKKVYDKEVIVVEYYCKDKDLNNKLEKYDKLLNEINDNNEIKEVVSKMLELYKDKDRTLVKVIS